LANTAFELGQALHRSGCLKFGSFRVKSGAFSPYYIDLSCLLSSPKDLCTVADTAANSIRQIASSTRIDKLASIELKGALLLACLGSRTGLPCTVVRKEEKTYGATGRTAGADIVRGECVLFFDDVITEGLSKLEGIKPLEQLGAKVENILVVVDREQGGRERLENLGYKVHSLARISELVGSLYRHKHIARKQADAVLSFIKKS
jgi:uridine monophosphate synthetase